MRHTALMLALGIAALTTVVPMEAKTPRSTNARIVKAKKKTTKGRKASKRKTTAHKSTVK